MLILSLSFPFVTNQLAAFAFRSVRFWASPLLLTSVLCFTISVRNHSTPRHHLSQCRHLCFAITALYFTLICLCFTSRHNDLLLLFPSLTGLLFAFTIQSYLFFSMLLLLRSCRDSSLPYRFLSIPCVSTPSLCLSTQCHFKTPICDSMPFRIHSSLRNAFSLLVDATLCQLVSMRCLTMLLLCFRYTSPRYAFAVLLLRSALGSFGFFIKHFEQIVH